MEDSVQRVGNAGRAESSRRGRRIAVATSAVALLALGACTSSNSGNKADSPVAHDTSVSGGDGSTPSTPSTGTSIPPATLAAVITTPVAGDKRSPSQPVTINIAHGKLTRVTMTNAAGKVVAGALAADGSSWHNTEDLGYSKTYKIVASGVDGAGAPVSKSSKVTTLTPDNQTMPHLQRIGGYSLDKGATYGVAIVPVVHFDEPITDEAAAEKALKVTTSPHVDGSWYWADNQNVHFRPKAYWPSGTKVTVAANVYGVKVGRGLYGQADASTSFTIGRKQVTIAYDTAPKSVNKVRVYNAAGHVIRSMNTSMGEHTGETVNGSYINFYTLGGTYTVLGHEQPAKMCSASYGLPANAPGGYACEDIYNATKISVDGIYLHELLTTIWAQNSGQDVSHGCLNLNSANSMWFFKHSIVGDPVVIHGAKGAPTLQVWEGGDWTVPWSKWVKGSAL
jgi:lipoprotein-anchoring transpeptidase ErfK/SrfK